VTVAYWFTVPAYATLWLGGSWFRNRMSMDIRGVALLSCSLFVAVSACFLISNGSFYWIGDRVAQRSWKGWLDNLGDWYLSFLQVAFAYVAVAAVIHAIVVHASPLLSSDTVQRR
jgi:hypothetical protein